LREQVKAKRLGKSVNFLGWLPEEQLHALVAAADAVVVPSLYEPFGIVALEAASVGTPLVVARTGGLAELVEDGVTGRTFAPGNVVELASALAQVLLDPPRAAASARAARTKVRSDFGWPAIAAQTVEVYREAIADESRPQIIPVAKLAGLVGPPDLLPGNLLTGAVS
jgi:glycogen(starch) synthase